MSDYRSIATIRRLAGAPVDHAREIQRHTARPAGVPRPTLRQTDRDIIKEMVRG